VADFDGDGMPEVGVANKAFYTMLDTDLTLLWSNPTTDESSSITGSSSYDFDGDGAAEVVYSDEHDVWVWTGADGTELHRGEGHASGTHLEYPLVVQMEPDGPPHIVVASNNLSSDGWNGITLLADVGRAWVPTRRVWNQHAFMPTHINDDMSIPLVPDMPWPSGLGFRQNEVVTPPTTAAANLLPELHAVCYDACPDTISVRLRARNEGISAGSFELVIHAEGDPTPLASRTFVGGVSTASLTEAFSFDLAAAEVANVQLVATIDWLLDAPDGLVAECVEEDNSYPLGVLSCPSVQ
jgi:hypothetical protein